MPWPSLHFRISIVWFLLAISIGFADDSPEFSTQDIEFFETRIRPLLVEHCFECHSESSKKIQGGLRLDSRSLSIKGGDTGPAVIAGNADESLLIQAIRWQDYEMPPKGKLRDEQIKVFEEWISRGAPWPATNSPSISKSAEGYDFEKWKREHWSFRPVELPSVPTISKTNWALNEVDFFILEKLEDSGLSPNEPASDHELVRRIFFDLIGLPPSPEQINAFKTSAANDRSTAIRELIDGLLNSPHYGERWGRHWLDVSRYSDGFGGFLDNAALPNAWRYRDWVVNAFNDDLPFDQFLKLQICGDLTGKPKDAIATGFFALGPTYHSDGGDPESVAQAKAETLSDRLDTLGRGLLGLTLACARCHAHKFDPLPQEDYYAIAGIFNNSRTQETPLADPSVVEAFQQHRNRVNDVKKSINEANKLLRKEKRDPTVDEKTRLDKLEAELKSLNENAPAPYDKTHALAESGNGDMHLAIRGDLRKKGEKVPRRFLQLFSSPTAPTISEGSGRKELADSIVDPRNPLTARVFVNRVWMHHFGKALVRTPSNFGSLGEAPTHPELLDWLAVKFRESGWSIKELHRTIMNSAAYRMSARHNEAAFSVDGDNRLVWRQNPRRLDVESWRDALLSVTGELDRKIGGPPVEQVDGIRRTLYFKVSRNGDRFATDKFLRLFDFPLMRATIEKRPSSIVPQQFLFLMNSPFMIQRARSLADRLKDHSESDEEKISFAYQLLFGREPRRDETSIGISFVRSDAVVKNSSSQLTPWQRYAQVLLSSNEFMYIQ